MHGHMELKQVGLLFPCEIGVFAAMSNNIGLLWCDAIRFGRYEVVGGAWYLSLHGWRMVPLFRWTYAAFILSSVDVEVAGFLFNKIIRRHIPEKCNVNLHHLIPHQIPRQFSRIYPCFHRASLSISLLVPPGALRSLWFIRSFFQHYALKTRKTHFFKTFVKNNCGPSLKLQRVSDNVCPSSGSFE
jgi:hypothetical protein